MTRIAKLSIKNILGVSELEFEAGRYNEIKGRNGSGKTSILEAIKAALKGGHDATLLRTGQEEGEAVLVLDDGRTVTKRVKGDQSQVEVRDAAGKVQKRPASIIGALTDLISANPVDFLRAPAKMRVQVLLESMPLEIDNGYLQEISGLDIPMRKDAHPIEHIDAVRQEVYDARRASRRAHNEKTSTILQLSESLPDQGTGAPAEDKNGLIDQLNTLTEARDAEFKRVQDKLDGLADDAEKRIQAIRDELEGYRQKANLQRERTQAKFVEQTTGIRERMAVIEEGQRQAAQHARTREVIASMREEAERLEAETEAQGSALERIDAYREKLLSELPIPGLTVTEGQVFRDGVQFDRLNTAQQVEIAVEIAKLRAGELGVICVDGLELLDSERYEAFKERALASDLQLFVSRVEDSDFNIASEA